MKTIAPAKVNLILSVLPKLDANGYHSVETVMCPLSLADEIEIVAVDGSAISCVCDPDPIPADTPHREQANIAWRAASEMSRVFNQECGLEIRIQKRIPSQAGLGGGSSDAAAVIRLLATMWGIKTTDKRLTDVASSLGAV